MATTEKKFLSYEKLGYYDEKIKKEISDGDAATLASAKTYADGLADNYDAAGTAATKVAELADGQVKTNTDAIAKLNGADTVEGSVAKQIKDASATLKEEISASAYDDTEIKGKVAANETAIATLNGTGAGSVKKQIDDAFNDFATKISDDNVVNTYKELIDYCATHSSEAAEMVGNINANKEAIAELESFVGKLPEGTSAKTVIDYINAKVEAAKADADKAYATAAQGTKADSALQQADVTEGKTNGTIAVKGADVKVHGLGTAAYAATSDFDAAGSASAVQTSLDTYKTSNDEVVGALETDIAALKSVNFVEITDAEIDALFSA